MVFNHQTGLLYHKVLHVIINYANASVTCGARYTLYNPKPLFMAVRWSQPNLSAT